ncbi:F-box domain/F-box-like [Novymonas esmeraldas]|uniref:F-box domain/F-box-like n=1 Tax=Novymonas esmeraldas TaxID=1808958 RepID=A0AAW0EJ27_9TRYP
MVSLANVSVAALQVILAFCDYAELASATRVCRSWRRYASRSDVWRRVAQRDVYRARNTEYQIVVKTLPNGAASPHAARLYTAQVRTREHHRRDNGGDGSDSGGTLCAASTRSSASSYTAGSSASAGISGLGSSAEVRDICTRYLSRLTFTAGSSVAAVAHREASAGRVTPADAPPLPVWEDGCTRRSGVLLYDRCDPGAFCYYAATPLQPWCTVLMDQLCVSAATLCRLSGHPQHHRPQHGGDDSDEVGGSGSARCLDLAFRFEVPAILRHDPPHRPDVVTPRLPPSLRIGVVEAAQMPAYRRGLHRVVRGILFYPGATFDAAVTPEMNTDDTTREWRSPDHALRRPRAHSQPHQTPAATAASIFGRCPSNSDCDDLAEAATAEEEVAAWLAESVQEASRGTSGRPSTSAEDAGNTGDVAFAVGDTPCSYGYDAEGFYISAAASYPLGAPLMKGDVLHVSFLPDEDVIVVSRNTERLGTLVADAFSDDQRWYVAVSLRNSGVRVLPPPLL